MNLSATLILAFGMSMDAFAASIGKGASLHQPRFREAIRTGLIFGVVEAITPLIGWAIGLFASQYIMEWDHWVAFSLLFILGMRMIVEGCATGPMRKRRSNATASGSWSPPPSRPASTRWLSASARLPASEYRAYRHGHRLRHHDHGDAGHDDWALYRPAVSKRAEILGGVVLIGIGVNILLEHLGYLT